MKIITLIRFAATLTLLLSLGFSTAQTSQCPTDLNNDAITNAADFTLFSPQFNSTCTIGVPCPTDFNSDGVTDVNDFLIYTGEYGQRCNVWIFGVSTATFSGGYVDIPVSISSDLNVFGLDLGIQFNLAHLTYNSVISYPSPYNNDLGYFNPNTLFFRYTTTILNPNSPVYYPNDVTVFILRFATSQVSVSEADFTTVETYINGNRCGYMFK